jgi:archaellum component FlaF (FlaF/FlaG flagellin family)
MKKTLLFAVIFLYSFGYAQSIWFEGFESAAFPPVGWSIIHNSGIRNWEKSNVQAHTGTYSALHDWSADGLQESALISPPITLPNVGNSVLEFWSFLHLIGYQHCSVLISTTVNNDLNAFTEVKVLSGNELILYEWIKINIPLNDYVGETIYIAFLYSNTDGPKWYIDDIDIIHMASFVDMQALSLTPITGEYAMLSNNEQVTVRVKNNGGNPASGFGLKLLDNGNLINTETFTSSVPSMGEATYIFNTPLNLTAAGLHKVQVVVDIPGDQVPANDTTTSLVMNLGCTPHTTFPFEEGFENNGNNLPPCWTQEYVAEHYNWRVCDAAYAQGIPGLYPKGAFEGNYKIFFYTNGKDGAITKLVSPPMDITAMNNPVLKFYHIQQQYSGDQDSLKVYYRTSSNGAWVFLAKYTETVAEWTERTLPLPEPSNQYYIAFEGIEEYGHSIQLDNIFVGEYVATDIAVQTIAPSGVHVGLSNQETVTATIKNNGRTSVTGFSLSLYLNGSLVATEIFTDMLQGLDEVDYLFNTKIDLSVSGTYTLRVVADLEGDEVEENNEMTVTVKNIVCDALTYPYDEGFEEEIFPPHCWTKVGNWLRMPYDAHTGYGRAQYAWWDGSLGWLISPKFSIPEEGNFILEFWSYCYEPQYYVYSGVWISTTNTNPASFIEVHELTPSERPAEVWVKIEVPLNNYAGQDIYIAFKYRHDGGQSGHLWAIDDVNVLDLNPRIDAEMVAISDPPSLGMNLTNEEPVTVRIKNNGGSTISGFQLKLEHNGAVVATENYTGYINSLVTTNYTFTQKLDLSAAGNHTIKATVILAGDIDPDNDSKTKIVENRICPVVTNFPWYGEFQGNTAGEITDCWANIDADGDTKKWWSLEEFGTYYAVSESYDAYYEFPLSPDNWLITPPLALNRHCLLSYKVGGANSGTNGAEKYSILVSTTNIDPASFAPIHTETLSSYDYTESLSGSLSGYGVKTINIPLSSYTGKTVHLAFRHWDCTGQDMLLLTDIKVSEALSVVDATGVEQPLVAWVYNDHLYVKGLQAGNSCNVYSATGQLVYTHVAHSETMSIKLNTRGFYMVQSGTKVVKVVY